ncbi:hypothetical protein Zmor_021502 [Zophobas morio]|uniref:Uncharacterized protein n=1 Tax=Zophobas morio TaxID=2755281 RepID=A0AA38MB19_9CUCU|nr:hypothetical protein Zmor_021502 [Zophobas morio]
MAERGIWTETRGAGSSIKACSDIIKRPSRRQRSYGGGILSGFSAMQVRGVQFMSEKNEGLVGVWDGTWRDTMEMLREFFPVDVPVNYELYEGVERVNYDKVESRVRSIRKKKSPGMDGVMPEMMGLV